ncbi:MAG TPA: HD domain-containing protein [Bacteroidia bacterium]|jgi:HD superfamily phosphohydrolase|nr:HD domain-containing protein [Bacteroidia bacterium]
MPIFKSKIINDPIYGFVTIQDEIIYALINHSYFQRLRRIKQLGLTNLVYPGALHTRFHHAIGAMHLMSEALQVLKSKDVKISDEESRGALIAILLHDIGHGPFSHSLEHSIVKGVNHEVISSLLMDDLNKEFKGKLSLAIKIFNNKYSKKFLHQLVSSQLDMDRLDYLKRDSFFTGVSEGIISSDRIIKTLNVVKDNLVVEAKGIYSIEKFLISRRLMYWQVYLHKTVLSAENLLINILKRAKELSNSKIKLFGTPTLILFLENDFTREDFAKKPVLLEKFAQLDDYDIMASVKAWAECDDFILSELCKNLLDRHLYKIELQNEPIPPSHKNKLIEKAIKKYSITRKEVCYFVFPESVNNSAYNSSDHNINILYSNGKTVDVAEASDLLNIQALSKPVTKHYICYPKDL